MSEEKNAIKLHNPKSHAPAVYIPCWLIQVSIKLISHGAKMTYGRLSQWADELGHAYRSAKQLGEELGTSADSIEKYLKELRTVKLLGTYHPQAGGVNHFEFYDHPWMHIPLKEQLVYKKDKRTLPPDLTVPPVRSYGTLPPDLTDINIKEIKRNKKDINTIAHPADERALKTISQPQTPDPKTQSPESTSASITFNAFWDIYPRKVGKKKALDVWKRKKLNINANGIIDKLKVQVAQDENWLDSQYIPHPTTYLNGERWDDEIFRREVKNKCSVNQSKNVSIIDQDLADKIQTEKSRAEGLKVMQNWKNKRNQNKNVVSISSGTLKSMGSLLENLRK
jgi:hypothetical protein